MNNRQTSAALILALIGTAAAESSTQEAVAHVVRDTAWSAFEWGMTLGGGGVLGLCIGIIACCVKMCADGNCCSCDCECSCPRCCQSKDDDLESQKLTSVVANTETPGQIQDEVKNPTQYQTPAINMN